MGFLGVREGSFVLQFGCGCGLNGGDGGVNVVFELQSGCDVALFWGDVGFMLGSLLGET